VIDFLIKQPLSYEPGSHVVSPYAGPRGAYRCRLMVYPRGDRGDPSNKIPEVAIYVQVLPPTDVDKRDWSCKGVECTVRVCNRSPDCSVVKAMAFTFSNEKPTCGWRTGFLKSRFINLAPQGWLTDAGELHVQAEIKGLPEFESLGSDFIGLDFTEDIGPVSFRVAEGPPLLFDKRLLMARSEYFREMLSASCWKESRTGEIDLSSDPMATCDSVSALLRFIVSDTYQGSGQEELAFAVRMLADRYRLHKLVEKVDAELQTLLSEDNVLSFLGRLFGTNSRLESLCLEMIENNGASILEQQQANLDLLISENPSLAKKLILIGFRSRKRIKEE